MAIEKVSLEYFEREKQSRFLLQDYLDSDYQTIERLNIAKEILWWDVNQYVEYEKDEDTGEEFVDTYHTDRDWIDEAIRNYYEPLSIKKYVSVDPWTNEIEDVNDCAYELAITVGWPGIYIHIDWTAELIFNWWWDHLTRDFGKDFANTLLSFYWLD